MSTLPSPAETLALETEPISAVDLALYAAASGDLNPLHLDADVARAAGFDKPIAQGMRTMACTARLFTQRYGATSLRSLETRFTGTAKLGDRLVVTATLLDAEAGLARYAIKVDTSAGNAVATGSASVSLSP